MPDERRTITLAELFTDKELQRATKLFAKGFNAQIVADQVVTPVLPRINEKTGQENNALYWACALQYAISQQ